MISNFKFFCSKYKICWNNCYNICYFSQINAIHLFHKNGDNFIFIVSLSLLLSSITSLYIPMFSRILYSGHEKDINIYKYELSINNCHNVDFINYVNFLTAYLIFELFNFIYSRYLFKGIQNKFLNSILVKLSQSYLFIMS